MDALSIPAAGGVDTTAVIVGDFSNGNDAVILKDKDKLKDILGQNVNLVEFSVSHYLLARALESIGAQEKDLKVVNTSDADMAAAFKTADVTAVVTWKPIVSTILESPDAKKVFDSSKIPGEIIDLMVVNSDGAEGQSEVRQGACRHLVRDAGDDEVRHGIEGGDGEGVGHRPQGLRRATRHHRSCSPIRRTPSRSRPAAT